MAVHDASVSEFPNKWTGRWGASITWVSRLISDSATANRETSRGIGESSVAVANQAAVARFFADTTAISVAIDNPSAKGLLVASVADHAVASESESASSLYRAAGIEYTNSASSQSGDSRLNTNTQESVSATVSVSALADLVARSLAFADPEDASVARAEFAASVTAMTNARSANDGEMWAVAYRIEPVTASDGVDGVTELNGVGHESITPDTSTFCVAFFDGRVVANAFAASEALAQADFAASNVGAGDANTTQGGELIYYADAEDALTPSDERDVHVTRLGVAVESLSSEDVSGAMAAFNGHGVESSPALATPTAAADFYAGSAEVSDPRSESIGSLLIFRGRSDQLTPATDQDSLVIYLGIGEESTEAKTSSQAMAIFSALGLGNAGAAAIPRATANLFATATAVAHTNDLWRWYDLVSPETGRLIGAEMETRVFTVVSDVRIDEAATKTDTFTQSGDSRSFSS